MGRLAKKLSHNLYTQNYLQSGGGHDFPVYKGKGGNMMHVYKGRGGGLGRILGRFIKPILRTIIPRIKKEAVKGIKKHVLPIGKKVAKKALEQGMKETEYVIRGKKNIKKAIKDLGRSTKENAKNVTVKHMRGGGSGKFYSKKVKSVGKNHRKDVFSRLPKIKNV